MFGPATDEVGGKLLGISLSRIIDGTSKAAAFAEVVNGRASEMNDNSVKDGRTDCFEFSGSPSTGSLDAVRNSFLSKDWESANLVTLDNEPWRFRGYPWAEGTMWRGWYNHLLPPGGKWGVTGGRW